MFLNQVIAKMAGEILSDKEAFCALLREAHTFELTNFNYDAARLVRWGVEHQGILLLSHNHSDDICSIWITEKPDIPFKKYDNDEKTHLIVPTAAQGYCWPVWENGGWSKIGPWREKVITLIDELIVKIKEKIAEQQSGESESDVETDNTAKEMPQDVREAWGETNAD